MKIQKDKILHFSACAIIALITFLLFWLIGCSYTITALAALLISTAAGWGKEYGDKANPNNKWDWKDILADAVGTVIGILFGYIIFLL